MFSANQSTSKQYTTSNQPKQLSSLELVSVRKFRTKGSCSQVPQSP